MRFLGETRMIGPKSTPPSPGLKLHALDAEDLSLVSAHLQDALARISDLVYLPKKRRFALIASRFDWSAEADGRLERVRAGLHFEGVMRARCRHLARDRPEAILSLLAVVFEPGQEPPAGCVRLIFAGGADILLEVEYLEVQLTDIGPRWTVASRPAHNLDEAARGGP
jgi:hypothetical protein